MQKKKEILSPIDMEILPYLPCRIKYELMKADMSVLEDIEEIRLRAGKPVMLTYRGGDGFLHEGGQVLRKLCMSMLVTMDELAEVVYKISENSWYAYQDDINRGFITIRGGHRIGIIGTPVIESNKIINMKDISSLNIRIAREVIGCGEKTVKYLVNGSRDIYNTLIISPPGMGKTTLLRDIIRLVSNGFTTGFSGLKVGVIDERGELAASCRGIPQNDLGCRTDVIHGIHKKDGMEIMLRSMSPNVIALDELGNPEDVCTILQVMNAGIRIMATAHGFSVKTLQFRRGFRELFTETVFERFVVISMGRDFLYEIRIMDGDENVLAVDCQSDRKPACFGELNDGRVCVFPAVNRKNRMYKGNPEVFIGNGE